MFSGKKVAVLGTRYGLQQMVFEHFGAKTYGVDIHPEATGVARLRGLNAVEVPVRYFDREFSGQKPDFFTSVMFLDPAWWRQHERDELHEAMWRHSQDSTIHVHQWYHPANRPLSFRGFNILSRQPYQDTLKMNGELVVLKKKAKLD